MWLRGIELATEKTLCPRVVIFSQIDRTNIASLGLWPLGLPTPKIDLSGEPQEAVQPCRGIRR
jgi:hypothetical protein